MRWKIFLSINNEDWITQMNVELYDDKPTLFPVPVVCWRFSKGSEQYEHWYDIQQRMFYDEYKSWCDAYEKKLNVKH